MVRLACVLAVVVAALLSASGSSFIPSIPDVLLEVGSPLHLDCGVQDQHRHCFWETEDGRVFQVRDVYAGRHAGMRAPHNITHNQCGIVVKQATARDVGTWTCKVFLQGNLQSTVKNVVWKEPKACQAPFMAVGTGCFYFSSQLTLNWNEARTYCHSLSTQADLAVVDDCYLLQLIWSHIIVEYGIGYYWIGATDEHQDAIWRWVDDTQVAMGTPFWRPGEPNNFYGDEGCLAIWREGYFNDNTCTVESNFICQDWSP